MHSQTAVLYGAAVVSGEHSFWLNTNELRVGSRGTLTVSDAGSVTTKSLFASIEDLKGNGTIAAFGAVLDADLRFDAAHPASRTLTFGDEGTLTVNMGAGSLGAGFQGTGTLTVAEGVEVTSEDGIIAYLSGSTGEVTVSGSGSKWVTGDSLHVGSSGNGTLVVETGGMVDGLETHIARYSGSTGTATVTGMNSRFTTSKGFYVGYYGSGKLNIRDGGQVYSQFGHLGSESGGTGVATVSGTNSKWINTSSLSVGYEGAGMLAVTAGGSVSARSVFRHT